MARKRSFRLRGIAEPILVRRPLFVRLCSAFVDNLTLILRIGLVTGAIMLIQDLRSVSERTVQPVAEVAPEPIDPAGAIQPDDASPEDDAVLSESVKQALNCTYESYRNEHYDDCVAEPSRIYVPRQAGPDDTGQIRYETPVMYARLDDRLVLE
jgi:hypothetical protein